MVELNCDEELFVPKAISLPPTIKTALWDFVERIVDNPDNPDLMWKERDGFRASQFTQGFVLDWEVTRRQSGSGAPEEVWLRDIRSVNIGRAA
jgi:hypothetical protein